MSDKNFPPSSGDSSKPVLALNQTVGETGPAAIYAYPATPVVPIPADNDGGNPDYSSNRSDIYIYQGGNLQSGWVIALSGSSNCSATVDNSAGDQHINIITVTADSGYADFTATLFGIILRFRVYFSKVKEGVEGAQGIQGDPGTAGSTGPQGDPGQDGSGLVIRKFTANVRDAYASCTASNNGSGFTRLTFGSDPDIEIGEYLTWSQGLAQDFGNIVTQISPTVYDTDSPYNIAGSVSCWSMRYYRRDGDGYWDQIPQSICIPNIIPVGGKLDEVAVLKVNSVNEPLFVSGGNSQYPDYGYDRYFSRAFLTTRGDVRQVNLWDPSRFGYDQNMIVSESQYSRNFFFYTTQFAELQYWNTVLSPIVFDFFISYKLFPTTFTG